MADPGHRERKKQATHRALREAALRLALERGPELVRVEDIAEGARVSPRTYNNYFSSREEAIVAAVTAERDDRVAAAVAARGADVPLAEAVVEAVVEQYTDEGHQDRAALLLVTTRPALRRAYVDAARGVEPPLAAAIAERTGDADAARVLAAAVAAAIRIALERWAQPTGCAGDGAGDARGLVVATGSLADLLREALLPLVPALDAADPRPRRRPRRAPDDRRRPSRR